MQRISFDPVAEVFDKTRGPPDHVMRKLLETLTRELRDCKIILDAGAGTGRFAKPLQDRKFEVIGVDISKKMIEVAKRKGTLNLFIGDVCFLPFRDASFDAAICNAVLHLIPEWKTALHEICRVTTEAVVSTTHERGNPLRDAYAHLLENYGYKEPKRGKPIDDLEKLVAPLKSLHVASYWVDLEESLEHMSPQRVFSFQWNIPESTHKEIIKKLRKQFSGKRSRQGIRLLIWSCDDLRALM